VSENTPVGPEAEGRLGHTHGVVLCDPASGVHALRIGGHTLAERTALLLAEICEAVVWVGAEPTGGAPGRFGGERGEGASEAEAVAAALEQAGGDAVLVLSADRPALSPDLVIGLAGLPDGPAAMPRDGAGAHGTCARYRRSFGWKIRAAAEKHPDAPFEALAEKDVRFLDGVSLEALDPTGLGLRRVVDAAALERAIGEMPECADGAWPGHPGLGLGRSVAAWPG